MPDAPELPRVLLMVGIKYRHARACLQPHILGKNQPVASHVACKHNCTAHHIMCTSIMQTLCHEAEQGPEEHVNHQQAAFTHCAGEVLAKADAQKRAQGPFTYLGIRDSLFPDF